jgi:flagellar hook-associated protein 1 FlgK
VQQVASLVDSVSGVSIDEESTNLIQFERAFQASSRLAVVVDEMLQTIVNLV